VPVSDVPVGGGTVLDAQRVVVTQPTAGTFKAFSAVCTHQGCLVAGVSNNAIVCPCHGSTFSTSDGSVLGGPAPAPLAAVPVSVSGSQLTIG
jgi:Rieske Fe-S protein